MGYKRRYTSKHQGEALLAPLTDEERHEATEQVRSVERTIRSGLTDKDRRRLKSEDDRRRREKKRLEEHPVKCRDCKIAATCVKRRTHNLTQCAYGYNDDPERIYKRRRGKAKGGAE